MILRNGTVVPVLVDPDIDVSAPGHPAKKLSKLRFSWIMMTRCWICLAIARWAVAAWSTAGASPECGGGEGVAYPLHPDGAIQVNSATAHVARANELLERLIEKTLAAEPPGPLRGAP